MRIDRCYCFQKTFAKLKAASDEHDAHTVEALQEYVAFGRKCQLCHPYVRRMLRTGKVVFDEVVREEDEPPE